MFKCYLKNAKKTSSKSWPLNTFQNECTFLWPSSFLILEISLPTSVGTLKKSIVAFKVFQLNYNPETEYWKPFPGGVKPYSGCFGEL